jgi:WD40 repeat protein
MNISHDEYAYAVESHPYLPLYVSGNHKGVLSLWNFNQMTDRSLAQWVCDPPYQKLAEANPKKTTIRKIAFSAYGDKMAAMN